MARILYCWETQTLADVPGRARGLARALAARGHELALMVSDTNAAGRELRGSGLAYYQAPVPVMALRYTRLRNFADSLAATGFLDLDTLRRLQRGWRQWFSLLRPDVLVVDHAPVAQLAACLNRMVCLRLGDRKSTRLNSSH